ncbi:GNAT family N-acetyltransferase [Sphingobium nicotianae]|uniref:GNAT family N-acetyltransferase n=1 Tax=Sphingobium nicotianae TaxID=2782607 RepID=A0A9X1DDV1_9SPHN|nr:GNAT family N-acetyltransferase [Sphingobium nicotianae]MBT2188231.1 GNAT family N-acetyltransferase [Sphingobium nicotianae]
MSNMFPGDLTREPSTPTLVAIPHKSRKEVALLTLETERLILRRWRNEDLAPAAAINADPEVMSWIGAGPMSVRDSGEYLTRNDAGFDTHGFGIWAVERKEDHAMIGFSGLRRFERPHHPLGSCIEAAWRFAREAWGKGYATEAARAAFLDGFNRCAIATITSWAPEGNLRSQGVMQRIGMTRRADRDFDTPALPQGHRLRRHVVFTADRATWPAPAIG